MAGEVQPFSYPAGFEIDPHKTAGNTHSGHNVVFGSIHGSRVALKPFASEKGLEANLRGAEHESRMYDVVKKLGYETLQPISVVKDGNVAFLLTEWVPNLSAATSVEMNVGKGIKPRGKSHVDVVTGIASTLAGLHEDGITHGDAKLRNFSIHRVTGEGPVVVDLEGAQQHLKKSVPAVEYKDNLTRNDLRSFAHNLGMNGFGAQLDPIERNDLFGDTFMSPYLSARTQPIPQSAIQNALDSYNIGVEGYIRVDHQYTGRPPVAGN